MPLSDDQKAMLRLLAQREEGYEDMAALMGLSVEEVRAKVKEALAEVDDAEPAGQEAPAAAPTPPPPPPVEPPAPQAPPPPAPKPPRPARPAFKLKLSKLRPPARGKGGSPGDNRGALVGVGAGAIVVVVLVIVLIVGGSGGGSSSSSTTATAETGQGETSPASAENGQLTQAILTPASGGSGSGSGRALFGRFKKNVLLQVEAEGLEPSAQGSSYAVWLSHGSKLMVPVGTAKVEASGKLVARFAIPGAVLVLVARSAFNEIDVTQTSDAALSASIAKAKKENKEPAYTGTDALRGKITGPLVGAEPQKTG